MSVTVVGSVALDTVETPFGVNEEGLGGAAVFFSLAAIHFAPIHLVGVVGEDFPQQHIDLLARKRINLEGLERAPGKTFRWSGRYHDDINLRDTLDTQLNVFETFDPRLPSSAQVNDYLFLGNIHPSLQLKVLSQSRPKFVCLDTMNLWIEITNAELREVLAQVDALIINDMEARQLTGEQNLVKAAYALRHMGPHIVVIKKGEHGAFLFEEGERHFVLPALPLADVVDPTGAGDSFAGGFVGYIAQQGSTEPEVLRRAVVYGSVVASFTCQAFGPARIAEVTRDEIDARYEQFRKLTHF